jgi:protein-disulfide isomerase
MNGQRERLAKELEQLQKTFKAGIITEKEFARGKERIDAKLLQVQDKAEKERESRKIVQEILEPEEMIESEAASEEPRPEHKTPRPVKKVQKKKLDRQPKREPVEEGTSNTTKIIIFAGILFVILLIVLVKAFTPKPIDTGQTNLTYEGTATIDFYLDATCPYSRDAWQVLLDLKDRYGEHISVKVKHFPMSTDALVVANAIQCARDQNKHLAYVQRLFDNQENISNNTLSTYAWAEGIDMVQFTDCLDSAKHTDLIRQDMQEGYDRGVRSTPTFFIDGDMVIGSQPAEYFQERLDAKLANKG